MEPRPSEESIRAVRGITAALRANIDLMADEVRALETLRDRRISKGDLDTATPPSSLRKPRHYANARLDTPSARRLCWRCSSTTSWPCRERKGQRDIGSTRPAVGAYRRDQRSSRDPGSGISCFGARRTLALRDRLERRRKLMTDTSLISSSRPRDAFRFRLPGRGERWSSPLGAARLVPLVAGCRHFVGQSGGRGLTPFPAGWAA